MNTNNNYAAGAWHHLRGLIVLLALIAGLTPVSASERWETLQAIHWVENPNDSTKAGPCGELGAYQFREQTWRMHTQAPFRSALDRSRSDAVAVKHYEYIRRGLERAGLPVTPYNVALAWNGGLGAAIRGRASAATRNYAERVNNLAQQLGEARVARDGR